MQSLNIYINYLLFKYQIIDPWSQYPLYSIHIVTMFEDNEDDIFAYND